MKFNFLPKHFPSPKFLKPARIGISFSDSDIKAVSYDKFSPQLSLISAVVPMEEGAIKNGKIIDGKKIVEGLSVIKKNFHSPFVFFAIPDELTYLFSVSIPITKGSNITESVAFTIEENVPLSLADTLFDFVPIEIEKSESGHQVSVVVAACIKKEVEKFTEVIRQSGLEPIGGVHESQAIANALIPQRLKEISCIAHARKNRVGIYLIKNNIVHFATLRSIVDGDYKKQFLDEYDKFLEYTLKYDAERPNSMKTVFVCGEFEYAKKTAEAILESDNSMKNVKLANVWANILKIEEDTPSITFENSLNLAGPIGATLSDII